MASRALHRVKQSPRTLTRVPPLGRRTHLVHRHLTLCGTARTEPARRSEVLGACTRPRPVSGRGARDAANTVVGEGPARSLFSACATPPPAGPFALGRAGIGVRVRQGLGEGRQRVSSAVRGQRAPLRHGGPAAALRASSLYMGVIHILRVVCTQVAVLLSSRGTRQGAGGPRCPPTADAGLG